MSSVAKLLNAVVANKLYSLLSHRMKGGSTLTKLIIYNDKKLGQYLKNLRLILCIWIILGFFIERILSFSALQWFFSQF